VQAIDSAKRRVTLDCRRAVGDMTVLEGKALVPALSRKFD
jgi:3-hydroxybutyryl-CoA dehydratase